MSLNPFTGEINPSASIPGLYDVYYTINTGINGCNQVTSAQLVITGRPTAFINYPGSPFCNTELEDTVDLYGGTYNYTGGEYTVFPIGLSFDSFTGEINPSLSIPNTYTVTYTTPPGYGCSGEITTASVTINAAPLADLEATESWTFCDGGSVNIHLEADFLNLYQW